MTDLEQMQQELSDDLMGKNGQLSQSRAIMDVADLMIGSAFNLMLVKGGGDIGVKNFDNEIIIHTQ